MAVSMCGVEVAIDGDIPKPRDVVLRSGNKGPCEPSFHSQIWTADCKLQARDKG